MGNPLAAVHIILAVHPLIPPIIGALVGVIGGALISGFLVQRHWVKRTSETTLIDRLTKAVDDIVATTLDYWNLDYSGNSAKHKEARDQARALATKIKAASQQLQSDLQNYQERYRPKVDFSALMGVLHDACTNGEFEAAKRGPDLHRYVMVVHAAKHVKDTLFERRV